MGRVEISAPTARSKGRSKKAAQGGQCAFRGRLGKDRILNESRHSPPADFDGQEPIEGESPSPI
jgi:hypothetical protein